MLRHLMPTTITNSVCCCSKSEVTLVDESETITVSLGNVIVLSV